jgi:hypothetical protein
MNPYSIFTAFVVILINVLHSIDNRALINLLDPPEYDTAYSICYILTPPSVPLTIDPSPPVLAPPFDLNLAPTPPHTFTGATSAGYATNNFSVDWEANLVTVFFIALLLRVSASYFLTATFRLLTTLGLQGMVNGFVSYIGDSANASGQ